MATRISPTTEQALAGAVAGHRMAGRELAETELAVLRRQADGALTSYQPRAELLASIRRPYVIVNHRDPYADPAEVLRNRLGITDPDDLQHYERLLAASRVVELELNPIDGRFDFAHLQAIHHYILQDVYDWAGELRT